jgi:hypothetical protein
MANPQGIGDLGWGPRGDSGDKSPKAISEGIRVCRHTGDIHCTTIP